MAINKAGTLALVANRADDSVSVLSIDGKNVKPEGAVSVSTQPMAAVATHLRRCLLPSQSPPTASMHSSSRAARYPTQLL